MGGAKSAPEFRVPQPGPEHEVLKNDVGTWDATIEIHTAPGMPPVGSKGIARNRLGCGGLWLILEFLNETTGFEGHGVYGYDPAKGKYVGTWVDPMRTFLAVCEGSYDPVAGTMTMWFEATGAHGKQMRWREVTERKDSDTRVWHQYMSGANGQDFETMTATYRRRSAVSS